MITAIALLDAEASFFDVFYSYRNCEKAVSLFCFIWGRKNKVPLKNSGGISDEKDRILRPYPPVSYRHRADLLRLGHHKA